MGDMYILQYIGIPFHLNISLNYVGVVSTKYSN
jgi:hypothetical protein